MSDSSSHPPFTVKRDDTFSGHQQGRLYNMQQSGHLTDFTIRVGGDTVKCHKLVMIAVCPYFEAMIESGLQEVEKEELKVDYLDLDVVKEVVKYCYTGEITMQYNQMKTFVFACDFLQLQPLKKKCEEYITKELNVDNCIGWYKEATSFQMEDLRVAAQSMMCKEFTDVCESKEFQDISLAELTDFIKDDNVCVRSSDAILNACIDWVLYDKEDRKNMFEDVLKHVKLEKCSAMFLHKVSTESQELFESDGLKQLLIKTFQQLAVSLESNDVQKSGDDQENEKCTIIMTMRNKKAQAQCLRNNTWKSSTIKTLHDPEQVESDLHSICFTRDGIYLTGILGCHLYSFVSKTWIKLLTMNIPRSKHGSVIIGRNLFIFGGEDDSGAVLASLEVFSLGRRKQWDILKPMLHPLYFPIGCHLGMNIFVILNNWSTNSDVSDEHGTVMQIFDTVKCKWYMGPNLPEEASDTAGASAVGFKGNLYVVGGGGKLCSRYSPPTKTWTVLSKPMTVQIDGAVLLKNNVIIIYGGSTNATDHEENKSDVICEYDILNDTWSTSEKKCPYPLIDYFAMETFASNIE